MSKEISIPQEVILSKVYEARGQKVMLDSDLADLYEVERKVLKDIVNLHVHVNKVFILSARLENISIILIAQRKLVFFSLAKNTCPYFPIPNSLICYSIFS